MCGITGYIGQHEAINFIIEGLTIMQNRGYDSAGICTINPDTHQLVNTKKASTNQKTALEYLNQNTETHQGNSIGIGHTRWATHGSISDTNAHPHLDAKNRVAVVHNGIIENFYQLKAFLEESGITFKSETDTEIISCLIGYYLDQGMDAKRAILATLKKLRGTWGLAILFVEDPNRLYLCKNGSPLLIGYDEYIALVGSESSAFKNHVKKYLSLRDNEMAVIERETDTNKIILNFHNTQTYKIEDSTTRLSEGEFFEDIDLIELSPAPYEHWMLKEIMEQSESLMRSLNNEGRIGDEYSVRLGGLENNVTDLLAIKHLLILGCGTSFNAALLGSKIFKILQSFESVQVIDASEFNEWDLPNTYNTSEIGVLVLSQSGETKDVHRAMELAKSRNILTFAIVNVVGSLIAREATCGVYLNAGREVAVASTKSFTSQVVALTLIAIWFAQHRNKNKFIRRDLVECLKSLPNQANQCLKSMIESSNQVAHYLKNYHSIFLLGRNTAEPIAYEGALKIKEIGYLHAEGYPGGSLKHGPFALIQQGTPIIIIMLDDEHANKMEIAAAEVKSRGAKTILITDMDANNYNNSLFDYTIKVPPNKYLSPILSILPLQYIAYKLALEFGHNPDYPRNLAKVVTVDG